MAKSYSFRTLFKLISRRRRLQLLGLIVLIVAGALSEMVTLGTVVPLIGVLSNSSENGKQVIFQHIEFLSRVKNAPLTATTVFGFIVIISGILRLLLNWASLRFSFGLGSDIGAEVYKRTLYQRYSWHIAKNSSEILSGIEKVSNLINFIISPIIQGCVAFVLALGILGTLIYIEPITACMAIFGFALIYGLTMAVLRPGLIRRGKLISEMMEQRLQSIQEGLGGIREVILDGSQQVFHDRFVDIDRGLRSRQATNLLIGTAPRYIVESAGIVLIVFLAYWLTWSTGGIAEALPVLAALAIGAQKLLPQMQQVYAGWSYVNGNLGQLEDVLELLDNDALKDCERVAPLIVGRVKSVTVDPFTSRDSKFEDHLHRSSPSFVQPSSLPLISMSHVAYRYAGSRVDVISGLNLNITRGMRVGIIGATGCGKSTLTDLIMGLLEPTFGEIKIEGRAINNENRRDWQRRLAHVPQSIFLTDSSIAENIAFGVPLAEIDLGRVIDAAKLAQLSDFVEALPDKYSSPVGERGVRLSGGQRQRIGIARALYKQAEVLILDEATSALDDTTEARVMESISKLERGITVLIISHRVSTLRDCNKIVELRGGIIHEVDRL